MHTIRNGGNTAKEPIICTIFMGKCKNSKFLYNELYSYLNKQLAKEKLDAESQHTFMADDTEGPFPHMSIGDVSLSIFHV